MGILLLIKKTLRVYSWSSQVVTSVCDDKTGSWNKIKKGVSGQL